VQHFAKKRKGTSFNSFEEKILAPTKNDFVRAEILRSIFNSFLMLFEDSFGAFFGRNILMGKILNFLHFLCLSMITQRFTFNSHFNKEE
jgi:hypothetical protein